MKKAEILKHIKGYAIGFSVFGILIPFLIYSFSQINHELFKIQIFASEVLKMAIFVPLFIMGLFFAIWSNMDLFRVGKGGPADIFNIEVSPRSKKLVVTGPYRYSRNPMVFGANSIYFSIAIYLNSLVTIALIGLFLVFVVLYIKSTEEKRLFNDFGNEYLEYKRKVSMIIPLPPKKN